MGRSKKTHAQEKAEKLAKEKGKAVASSSNEPLNKRRRKAPIIEYESESEEDEAEYDAMDEGSEEGSEEEEGSEGEESEEDPAAINPDPNVLPEWDPKKPLSKMPAIKQAGLYKQKMSTLKNIASNMICEREVELNDFKPFGIVQRFEAMGWDAALTFCHKGVKEIERDAIISWMATLEKVDGTNPPKTIELRGSVGPRKLPMVMSFKRINQIAKFDKLGAESYVYPDKAEIFNQNTETLEWQTLLDDLFDLPVDKTSNKLYCNELKFLPKLMTVITGTNVIPRYGDKGRVRHYELRVLHALMTGRVKYSLRHLIMLNIWASRESKVKKMIPHCRLLTALLRKQGALSPVCRTAPKNQQKYKLSKLSSQDWIYTKEPRFHMLVDKKSRRYMKVLQHGLRPQEGEGAEEGVVAPDVVKPTAEPIGVVHGEEERIQIDPTVGGQGPQNMELPSGIHSWEEYWRKQAQYWHHQAKQWEAQVARDAKAEEDRKRFAMLGVFEIHELRNDLHRYHEQVRLLQDHERGLPYRAHPRPIDVSTLPSHDPCPGPHHMPAFEPSSRIPVQHTYEGSSAASSSSGGGSSGAVDFSVWRESFWRDIAGPPLPRRPYDDEDTSSIR